ncbi:MAG: ribonuclease E/G, partial [Caulobacter sp.]|nr:ribonuclease E/G [Caulobacter sp.]
MTKKMLIDAAHPEETRVVVVDGTRIEEFDFESQSKKQLRGNIYLAKVTRVEPSLQAAFIEYGGNRHGFLAFNEIHPDYYQIPLADRETLMRQQAEEEDEPSNGNGNSRHRAAESDDEDGENGASEDEDDVMEEELARRRRRLMKNYKIQEVIRRRQIMLVQVVKEERGNKGAALTTYLSLAGRYGVLMPNTARGGGISRKITVAADRKKLKTIVQSLDVPQGMGLIVRTAGAKRTKTEIKR